MLRNGGRSRGGSEARGSGCWGSSTWGCKMTGTWHCRGHDEGGKRAHLVQLFSKFRARLVRAVSVRAVSRAACKSGQQFSGNQVGNSHEIGSAFRKCSPAKDRAQLPSGLSSSQRRLALARGENSVNIIKCTGQAVNCLSLRTMLSPWLEILVEREKESTRGRGSSFRVLLRRSSVQPCELLFKNKNEYEFASFRFLCESLNVLGEQTSKGCLRAPRIHYAFNLYNDDRTHHDVDWFEYIRNIGVLMPTCESLGVPAITGQLGCSMAGAGKRRIFAIGNYVNQWLLRPALDTRFINCSSLHEEREVVSTGTLSFLIRLFYDMGSCLRDVPLLTGTAFSRELCYEKSDWDFPSFEGLTTLLEFITTDFIPLVLV
ncbi:hypothetical protein ZIOFF_074085 [Zingiber officinale]|uniref:Uncharacterized protein n=1 Tax=Zingiber officinale TaxID=94328 RepID=A0A8J5C8B2_ZINOF|nr:hypothetical protein ZIOFF_074085 [Zingiber officinale]